MDPSMRSQRVGYRTSLCLRCKYEVPVTTLDFVKRAIVGEIIAQWCYRNQPFTKCSVVSIVLFVFAPGHCIFTDPVILALSRIGAFDDRWPQDLCALSGNACSEDRSGRHIDVEQRPARQALSQHSPSNFRGELGCRTEIKLPSLTKAHGDCGQAIDRAFQCAGNRSRVGYIVAQVW